jgi:hypothetical protein
MHGPEPTAEELAYGRLQARIHGCDFDMPVFAAGYALGRKQAEAAVPACRSEYERPGGRNRGDRIVRCHLPDGHPGEHEEADTEATWTDRHA